MDPAPSPGAEMTLDGYKRFFFLGAARCFGVGLGVTHLWPKSLVPRVIISRSATINQAPVVQTLDSAIQRINHYPVDKYYGNQLRYSLDSDLSAG